MPPFCDMEVQCLHPEPVMIGQPAVLMLVLPSVTCSVKSDFQAGSAQDVKWKLSYCLKLT